MSPGKNSAPILIVEDDRHTAALIAAYLDQAGFSTRSVHDGRAALSACAAAAPQLIILDVMLPELDGWEVCREVRKSSAVPILFLTAREDEVDRILGLSLGADDYVVKPFSPRELVERVKAILRRAQPPSPAPPSTLSAGALQLDPRRHKCLLRGEEVALTAAEFKLLQALMSRAGQVLSRDELLDQLYRTGETVVDRVIDVHIGKLRQKIESDPAHPRYIETVRGFGYRFSEQEQA